MRRPFMLHAAHAYVLRHALSCYAVSCCAVLCQVAAEFLADVPPDAAVWGWKEPQAIYTLPFLVKVGVAVGSVFVCG